MAIVVFPIGVLNLISIYVNHDLVLSDMKALFLRVDSAIQGTVVASLVVISSLYLLSGIYHIKEGLGKTFRIFLRAAPPLTLLLLKILVDTNATSSILDEGLEFLKFFTSQFENAQKLFNKMFSPSQSSPDWLKDIVEKKA